MLNVLDNVVLSGFNSYSSTINQITQIILPTIFEISCRYDKIFYCISYIAYKTQLYSSVNFKIVMWSIVNTFVSDWAIIVCSVYYHGNKDYQLIILRRRE